MTTNTNTTALRGAPTILIQIEESIAAVGGDCRGCETAAELLAAAEACGCADSVVLGDGSHDPTIHRWLTERADDIDREIAGAR